MRYSESDNLAVGIQHLLQAREVARSIRGAPVVDASTTPRRRQDFDMIFLLAYPSKARQIMPMLRYYYAGDVPVYATSAAYSGASNAQKDRDLEGLIFCDMPWVFHHQMGHKNWPEQWNSYNRLFALGNDSFMLATRLNQLLLFPAIGLGDGSGALYMNANQQIARVLAWGQMKQGMPQEVTLGFVS